MSPSNSKNQIAQLLISKIRNKHDIDAKTELDLDNYVLRRVEQFFQGENQSEKKLIELNKEVTNAVNLFRARTKPHQ